MHEIKDSTLDERAFLIGICHKQNESREEYDYSIQEMVELAKTAGIYIVDIYVQSLEKPNPRSYIGSGKLDEIKAAINEKSIPTLLFNDNLSSSQLKNISQSTNCNIVDRTELILRIFTKHAKTYEAKLQVEKAQLEYSYSKLKNMWQHFSRIGGGVGVRGPGETQIEMDRRIIRNRISALAKRLDEIKKTTEIKQKKRSTYISICLIGYTNAGKSTLFNKLTSENVYVADELFATLDSTTRSINLSEKERIMITDTIGFIENFPSLLVQSFYSTLHEVRTADLLIHVVDINNPKYLDNIKTVNKVLLEINASNVDTIMVFNKYDIYKKTKNFLHHKSILNFYKNSIMVSAQTGENIDTLMKKIKSILKINKNLKKITFPSNNKKFLSIVQNNLITSKLKYIDKTNELECETNVEKTVIEANQELLDKSTLQKKMNPSILK